MTRRVLICLLALNLAVAPSLAPRSGRVFAATPQNDWEITPQSEAALERGLTWLKENQGPEGNWGTNDLGLVSMGVLAFLAAGHTPGRGRYGAAIEKSLSYVLRNAKPSGLLNISDQEMYNHGLSTFVLGQAHGMTGDPRMSPVLERALKLIATVQCKDGGWDYKAVSKDRGNDLSLAVMQAKALRSAVDSGFEVQPEVIEMAVRSVRNHYTPQGGRAGGEAEWKKGPGQFTYTPSGKGTLAMAAAGVVCLQEFGQYEDWRIEKSMERVTKDIQEKGKEKIRERNGELPFDSYTLYYVGQSLYQVGGRTWQQNYPILRDRLISTQVESVGDRAKHGSWRDSAHGLAGKRGELYATAVGCFILAIPNRYLPILQEGKIDSLKTHVRTP